MRWRGFSRQSDRTKSAPKRTADIVGDVEKAAVPGSGVPVPENPEPKQNDKLSNSKSSDSGSGSGAGEEPDPFANLSDSDAAVLREQLDVKVSPVNYFTLYRYATRKDLIIIGISTLTAILGGALQPLLTVVFGALAGTFQKFTLSSIDGSELKSQLSSYTLYFIYLGIAQFVMLFIANAGFMYTGTNISGKVRAEFLAAIMRQNIGFFDRIGAGEVTTRITSDTNLIQEGISEKVPLTLTALATFISAFIIAFARYWKLALILSCTIVAIVLSIGIASRWLMRYNKEVLEQYAKGGSLAEEVLSSIRNATAFNAQTKLAKQYDVFLRKAEATGIRLKGTTGVLIGILYLFIYLNYGLSFWTGSRFLVNGEMTLSQVLTIQLVIIIGAFSLGAVAPTAQAIGTGIAAAQKIFNTIDRVSPLDPDNEAGEKLEHVEGIIELQHIRHIYPSRPEVVVMEDVSLLIPAGKTTALVGASGCGKSTIVGLVERFYSPVEGRVLLDGHDTKTLNLRWLRRQVSLVSQEPTLFATTIFTNIAHGLIGTEYETGSEEKRRALVEDAARLANAHDFISQLPDAYETHVGERGFLLSGGQKQRVAIARAIVSNPKILLLDEATSALDTKSEGVVQEALDKAAEGRTTIVIAHRLSTIKNAYNIVVMSKGAIVEQGNHHELLEKKGAYYQLVAAQKIQEQQEARAAADGEEEAEDERPAFERVATAKSTREQERLTLARTKTSKMSVSSLVLKDKNKNDDRPEYPLGTLIKAVAKINRKEWRIMMLGFCACVVIGGAEPTAAVFFAKSVTALALPPSEYARLKSQASFWSLMYLMLAFLMLGAHSTSGIIFGFASEKLIRRARNAAFRHMLRQDMAFFDQEKNSAGALASFLSTESTQLAGISGATLAYVVNTLTTLIAASAVGLAIGWKLSLVCISTIPVLLICGFTRYWVLQRSVRLSKAAYEKSAAYACEAASAIRTVASLTREGDVLDHYREQIAAQKRAGFRITLQSSALYAAAQSLTFGCIALGFWYGGTLIGSGDYSIFQFFLCFTAIIFGAQSAGSIFAFAPDMGKARSAASSLLGLFDRVPAIDNWSEEGIKPESTQGLIEFSDVHFRYPTRPETAVLRGLNLTVKPGQYVALVGPSGCGKSTTIALLERFYDPLSGTVSLDGQDIKSIQITSYRSHISLVSQEPTLYQGTIKENILLGAIDDSKVTDTEIEHACRQANIYDFITSLPNGFATIVGSKGTLLSGGQKQRIAIARALLSNPTVLLLDEATSALDSESEKVVQEALDKAAKGRTTIAVAHRLSTIQKADIIYVFGEGKIVEQGTHSELMRLRGRYSELVNLQNLG